MVWGVQEEQGGSLGPVPIPHQVRLEVQLVEVLLVQVVEVAVEVEEGGISTFTHHHQI